MSETVKVILSDDVDRDEWWTDYVPYLHSTSRTYEIPAEQRDRWKQAMDAYEQMQTEIRQVMEQQSVRPPSDGRSIADYLRNQPMRPL